MTQENSQPTTGRGAARPVQEPRSVSGPRPVQEKWSASSEAVHYAGSRFSSPRAHQRDPDLIRRLLRKHGGDGRRERVLDLPCGTGRLSQTLGEVGELYLGADVSIPMLSQADAPAVAADAFRLPFVSSAFDTVVCCRLLHHLGERRELPHVVEELTRVSSDLVLASFWDADSLPAWRRRLGLRKDTTGRRPVTKRVLRRLFEASGGEVLGFAHSCRFVSMQCFIAVRVGNGKG